MKVPAGVNDLRRPFGGRIGFGRPFGGFGGGGFGFGRPFGGFGFGRRPFGFGFGFNPFLGGLAGGLLGAALFSPFGYGYGYGYPYYGLWLWLSSVWIPALPLLLLNIRFVKA